jgi:biofilm PGA synthesis N-glycosyltransferase PgaC
MLQNVTLPQLIAIGICALTLLTQLFYYFYYFSRIAFHKDHFIGHEPEPVSVIICAKNEIKNLKKNIYSVLDQVYPEFQVIVVNDCSWDESGDFLDELEKEYPHLKVVTIIEQEKYQHGKKFALTLGIKAAKYDLLLMTDADCIPANNNWLYNMQNNFSEKKDIILGYGAYARKKGLLNKLIRFDNFHNSLQFLSFAKAGMPYMGVGRNLAYRKDLFFKNKGFASHNHLLSGDDDLFINEVANDKNTTIEIKPVTFTISEPKTTFKTWFRQKKRHLTTSRYYKFNHKFVLGMYHFTHLIFYVSLPMLLIFRYCSWHLFILFINSIAHNWQKHETFKRVRLTVVTSHPRYISFIFLSFFIFI